MLLIELLILHLRLQVGSCFPMLLNGIHCSVWECTMKHNDLGVLLNMSGHSEYLLEVLPTLEVADGGRVPMVAY